MEEKKEGGMKSLVGMVDAKTMKTLGGEEIVLPKFTLRRELSIIGKYTTLIGMVGAEEDATTLQILGSALSDEKSKAYNMVKEILFLLTDKDGDWILDNTEMSEVVDIFVPFFMRRMTAITNTMKRE